MSKEIFEWSAVAAGNGLFAPVDGGWPEGMSRQDVNDASREDLASIRRWYNDPEWIAVRTQGPSASDVGVFARTGANECTITLAGVDLSGYFTQGRFIKIIDGSGAGVDLVTQCSVDATYGAGVTTITTKAAIDVAATDILTHASSILRAQAVLEDNSQFFIPATADAAGIQAAIDAADAAGGGVVFLNQSSYSIGTQIDITGTKGNVVIWGKSPNVTLLRTAAIGSIINFSNASKSLEIRNVKFDGDWLSNPTGNGYGLSVAACLSLLVVACEFVRCESGIRFTGSTINRARIRDSYFTFHRYGISSQAASDSHYGVIEGCVFDGSVMSLPAPASMRLAGQWLVSGNHLRNAYHASLVPIGIHIWDRTVSDLGGIRSVVVGNTISGGGATGVAIWMGAQDNACQGNTISGGSGTTGIRIGSNTASAFAERVLCIGNSIQAGSLGIQMTEFCRQSIIQGNSIRPNSGTCIVVAGDSSLITGNIIRNAPIGVDILASASENRIAGNVIRDLTSDGIIVRALANATVIEHNYIQGSPTRGINIESGALATLVRENYVPGIVSPVTNAATGSLIFRNRQDRSVESGSASSFLIDVPASPGVTIFGDIPLPGGGGAGTYMIEYSYSMSGSANFDHYITFGSTGVPATDTIVDTNTVAGGSPDATTLDGMLYIEVTDATWSRWSLSARRNSGTAGNATASVRITKVADPLG